MISVGERDGRKRLSVGRDMEELELEEGEACYYYDNNNGCEDDSIIDPDIALSYIDEKLQDVLGHFQKDFEGGVSAENLGPKFGGYGSFLPTYQRSPPEVHSNNRPRSPNNTHFEGGRQNSLVSSSTSISRSGATPTNSLLVPAARFPTKNPEINTCMPPTRAEDSTSICKTLKKPADSSDQKSLKLRIRVGSENLSTTNNAELYSGLGLDVSPSLSLDNSPTDSEGLSHDLQDAPDESPTSILQIMTTFPMHGSLLLSPLSDDLIHLLEKDRPWGKSGSKPVHRISTGTSVVMANGSDSTKGSRKILGEKRRKSYEKDAIGSGYSSDMQNCVGVPSKKEIDVDTLACEELVSKALKLPLLSNSFSNVSYPAHSKSIDNLTTNIKGMVKEESFDHTAKEDLELVSAAENDGMEKKSNGIISLSGGVLESEKTNHFEFPRKEGNKSREQADVSANTEHSKGRKTPNIDTAGVSKPSIGPKITSENEAGARLVKEQVSSGGKKKHKVTQIHDAPGKVLNDGLVTDSSLGHKIKKSSSRDTKTSKSDSKGFKNHLKVRDAYAELFGNLEAEEEDDKIGSEKPHSLEVLKDSDAIYENNQVECNNSVKVRSNASKVEKPCAPTEHPRLGSNMKTVNGNELNPSHAPIAEGPVLKEDWVLCDKCQTWRLLPLGRDPESLPKKWHCKMLDWLPGMNRCGISEEDTTKALRALYQFPTAPASETQTNNQHEYTDRKLLGVASVDAFHSGLENRTLGIQVADASGKKKYGSKDSANESKQAGLMLSSSKINNCQGTPYNRSLNDSIQSPAGDNGHQKNFRQSSTSVKEKQRNKLKERKKLIGSISSDGGAKNAKMKNKPETSLDNSRAPKKVKRDGLYHDNEHWAFDTAEENAGHSSSNGMSQIVSMKDRHIYKYKDSKTLDKSPQIHNPVSSGDGSLHAGKCDSKDSSKKRRKGNGNHHSSRSFPGLGCNSQDSIGLLEETCENGRRKEKRARVSKSEVKDSSGNKDNNEGKDERVRNKDQQIGQYLDSTQSQQTIDAMDSSKRLLGSLPLSMAATSSSSKVSGSQRNKSNLQELRASPVESVSSSPLRIPTVDKFTSTRRNDCQDAGSLSLLSPRRSSDGENGGGSDQSGMIKKGKTLSAGHNGSLDCQEADLGHISCVKVSPNTAPSPVIVAHDENAAVEPLPQFDQYASKTQNSERGPDKGRRNDGLHCNTGTIMKKSGKGSSKPKDKKDKNRSFRSDFDRCTVNESLDKMPSSSGEKLKAGQNKLHERTANHSDNNSLKDPTERLLNESTKEEIHSKLADNNGRHVRVDIISGLDKEQALLPNRDDGRSSKKTASDKTNGDLTSGRGKSLLALPARSQNETAACLQSIPGSKKETTNLSVGDFEDDALRDKRGKKDQSLSRDQPSTRHSTPMFNKVRDLDAPSPARKDPSNQAAANALKEATNLKHLADRLKKDQSSGSSDSTNLYFQAALKFLTAAALFESSSTGSVKHNEMNQSGQIYSSTAKLCEFCAHEYERSKDMATAALAYKCMEVAYMRVIYSSHSNANRYRNELQAALQIFPPGESPSSSASDVDNLNNPSAVDKGGLAKGVGSPQVTGAHVMTTRNRSNFTRLLNFAQEVSFAMEASRKSRAAFAAANSKSGDDKYKEGILCVKRALDFNFQDMDGLLRLVRVAMEEINR